MRLANFFMFLASFSVLASVTIAETASTSRQQNPSAVTRRTVEERPDLSKIIEENGFAAGAISICQPDLYDPIRFCTMGIALNWRELTGVPLNANAPEVSRTIEEAWRRAAQAGRAEQLRQGQTSASCNSLIETVEKASFWRLCDELRQRVQGSSPTRSRTPTSPSNASPAIGGLQLQ